MITTFASQQIQSLRRQRIFVALLIALLAMTAVAGVLGWSSHNTITRVYDEAVRLLAADGKPAPPNPFLLKPSLSLLSNMVVYIPLLGALLALVLGHLSLADDEADGVGRLIFSRPVSRTHYVAGKLFAVASVLAAALAGSLLVGIGSLLVVNRAVPAITDLGRLVVFYGLSWLYLMVFALVGMIAVLMTRRTSLALLSAMGVWLVITFAVPQFTSGLRPTESLNPITNPVSTSQRFFQITAFARPYSVAEQYKAASSHILNLVTAEPVAQTIQRVLPIAVLVTSLAIVTLVLVERHDFSRSSSNE